MSAQLTSHRTLISVRPDGYVDGASIAGVDDKFFRAEARLYGLSVHEVERNFAKDVVFTYLSEADRARLSNN
ncbi:hypothetical protein [Acidihalobacter aeolianus]|nr:hypothetical protein [Acidihalobacter aeolianus]